MIIAFTLTMPQVASWNGRWSGEDKLYVQVRSIGKMAKAREILDGGPYRYYFGDGWAACVSVREVTGREAAKLRQKSQGFCGYEWMIDRIISYGKILSDDQLPERKEITNANR